MSRQSPVQHNTYDCGIFTMLTIYLHSRGGEINKLMYTQQSLYDNKICRAFAALFMRNNKMPSPPSIQFQRPSGNSSENTRKHVDLTQDDAEVARRHKRVKTGDSDATQAKEGSRKRSAKSTSDSSQLTLDQIFVPKTRKKAEEGGRI